MKISARTKFPISLSGKTLPILVTATIFVILALTLREFKPIDDWLMLQAAALPQGAVPVATFMSKLGSTPFVIVVAVVWAAGEWLYFHRRDRALLMLSAMLALPIYQVFKILVHRARPVTEFIARSGLHGDSFPSGHSAGSFAVYATLAYLLYRTLPGRWRTVILVAFGSLIVGIGSSRVYLGAHFPTDVLGGWLIGLFVLLGIRRGIIMYEEKHHQQQVV